jgi:hypothetical protein
MAIRSRSKPKTKPYRRKYSTPAPAPREEIQNLSAAMPLAKALDCASESDKAEEDAFRRAYFDLRKALVVACRESCDRAFTREPKPKLVYWETKQGAPVYMTRYQHEPQDDLVFRLWRAEHPNTDYLQWFDKENDQPIEQPHSAEWLLGNITDAEAKYDLNPLLYCSHRYAATLLKKLIAGELIAFAFEVGSNEMRRIAQQEWRGEWEFFGVQDSARGGTPHREFSSIKVVTDKFIASAENKDKRGRKSNPEWSDIARKVRAEIARKAPSERPKTLAAHIALVFDLYPNRTFKEPTVRDNLKIQFGQMYFDDL